jgi:hypothetical protein
MCDDLALASRDADNAILAIEAGLRRIREKFAPERPADALCHSCGEELLHDYVRLRQHGADGETIWLHVGACLGEFAMQHVQAAEAQLARRDPAET